MNLYSFKTIGALTLIAATILIGCSNHDTSPSEPETITVTRTTAPLTVPDINIEVGGK